MTLQQHANEHLMRLRPYQPGRPIEEVAREHGIHDPDSIVKIASNENPLGPSPKAVEAMRRAAAQVHRYPDGGAYLLRHKLARRLDVRPEQIVFGNGSNEILEFIAHAFLGPGRSAVMSERAFVIYKMLCVMFDAGAIEVPMQGHTHDLDRMADAVQPETRVVFVSNPNNPTGTMVTRDQVERFLGRVPGDVLVVMDEAYAELVEDPAYPDSVEYAKSGHQVIALRTFSKAYGLAGLRIGYGVASTDCAAILERARQPFNTNAVAQAAAVAALDDDEHVARTREAVRSGLQQLEQGCADLGLEWIPSVANFMMVRVGDGAAAAASLEKLGVIVRPMAGHAMPEWVRVTVGTHDENAVFLRALREIQRSVAG
jgi:histidinol-phosphate aminotransferase